MEGRLHPHRNAFVIQISLEVRDADFAVVEDGGGEGGVGFALGENFGEVQDVARSAGSPASRRPRKLMPLTTRPSLTSRQVMTRLANMVKPRC